MKPKNFKQALVNQSFVVRKVEDYGDKICISFKRRFFDPQKPQDNFVSFWIKRTYLISRYPNFSTNYL